MLAQIIANKGIWCGSDFFVHFCILQVNFTLQPYCWQRPRATAPSSLISHPGADEGTEALEPSMSADRAVQPLSFILCVRPSHPSACSPAGGAELQQRPACPAPPASLTLLMPSSSQAPFLRTVCPHTYWSSCCVSSGERLWEAGSYYFGHLIFQTSLEKL